MINIKRRLVLCLLCFVVTGIFIPFCFQPELAAWNLTEATAYDFAPGQLERHYQKHGYQFGNITQEQYLQEARALLNASPNQDVLEKIRPNGDIEHYRVSTGEMAVMTKRGRIRTFFKTNYFYWLRR